MSHTEASQIKIVTNTFITSSQPFRHLYYLLKTLVRGQVHEKFQSNAQCALIGDKICISIITKGHQALCVLAIWAYTFTSSLRNCEKGPSNGRLLILKFQWREKRTIL